MRSKILLLILSMILLSSFVFSDLNTSLITVYKADNNTVYDDELGRVNMSAIDSPSFNSSCKDNGCSEYDGSADYHINSSFVNTAGLTNLTICAWFNVYDSGTEAGVTLGTRLEGGNGGGVKLAYNTATNKLRAFIRSNDESEFDGAQTVISADTWVHGCGIFSDLSGQLYVNAVKETVDTFTAGTPTFAEITGATSDRLLIGAGTNALTPNTFFNGAIDEIYIWNRSITSAEITELYNGNFYPFTPPPIDNFSVTSISNWTGSGINNFSIDYNGTVYNTTNGTLITQIPHNSTSLFNITVFAVDRFNKTYLNYNVSSDLEANLKQTQVNISFEFSTGDLVIITPINLSALDIGEYYNVTVGYEGLFPDAGFVNFSVVSSNKLFHPFNFTLNLTALDNSSFVYVVNETHNIITFLDENSSNPIDNATITVTSPNGIILNLSTNSSGQINFSYILNNSLDFGDYSYFFDKVGYVNISLSDVINESNIPHTRTYNLSRAKLNIFIYDRVTRELLNGTNVSIAFIGLFNETTDTGILIKDNLTIVGGDYLIYASAEGYKTSIRSLTFTNQEEFTLNFYLLNLSVSNAGTLFVSTKDSFFRDVPGAHVDLLEYIPSSFSYVSVDSCVSNVNAQCSFAVELNTKVYYIRATSIIDGTVFVAETSQNGEIFTVDNDIRNLIFFTRSTFSISTSTNLIYSISESFVNNISSISVDFFTSDGTAKEVCVEYFLFNNSDWVSVTGDTYCLFSSNALQNIDVDVTLNRSNTYQARIYVKEGFDNILETFDYPDVLSTGSIFDDDFKATIIMIFWIFALAFCLHQKNITLFFFLAIVISWAEVLLFPIFSIAVISVFKTIVSLLSMYVARKKQDFQ